VNKIEKERLQGLLRVSVGGGGGLLLLVASEEVGKVKVVVVLLLAVLNDLSLHNSGRVGSTNDVGSAEDLSVLVDDDRSGSVLVDDDIAVGAVEGVAVGDDLAGSASDDGGTSLVDEDLSGGDGRGSSHDSGSGDDDVGEALGLDGVVAGRAVLVDGEDLLVVDDLLDVLGRCDDVLGDVLLDALDLLDHDLTVNDGVDLFDDVSVNVLLDDRLEGDGSSDGRGGSLVDVLHDVVNNLLLDLLVDDGLHLDEAILSDGLLNKGVHDDGLVIGGGGELSLDDGGVDGEASHSGVEGVDGLDGAGGLHNGNLLDYLHSLHNIHSSNLLLGNDLSSLDGGAGGADAVGDHSSSSGADDGGRRGRGGGQAIMMVVMLISGSGEFVGEILESAHIDA